MATETTTYAVATNSAKVWKTEAGAKRYANQIGGRVIVLRDGRPLPRDFHITADEAVALIRNAARAARAARLNRTAR